MRTRTSPGPDYVNLHELNKSRIVVGGLLRVVGFDSNLFRIVKCECLVCKLHDHKTVYMQMLPTHENMEGLQSLFST